MGLIYRKSYHFCWSAIYGWLLPNQLSIKTILRCHFGSALSELENCHWLRLSQFERIERMNERARKRATGSAANPKHDQRQTKPKRVLQRDSELLSQNCKFVQIMCRTSFDLYICGHVTSIMWKSECIVSSESTMVYRNFRKIHSSTCTPFTIWGRSFTLYVAVTLWTKTTTTITTKYYSIPRPYAHCTYSKICTLAWFVCWFEILRLFHLWAHHLAYKHSRT